MKRTLNSLQRAFLLRSCTDGAFAARTRPCLLHQIKRCSAPCVGRVTPEDYATYIRQAEDFLSGRDPGIRERFAAAMESASAALEFETAASYRDRVRALAHIQARQGINVQDIDEADVIAAAREAGQTCIQVFFFRGGQNWGNRAYFPRHDRAQDCAEVLAGFVGQFYEDRPAPPQILLSEEIAEADLLAEALSQKAGYRVRLHVPERGEKRKPVEHALVNAREALARRLAEAGKKAGRTP